MSQSHLTAVHRDLSRCNLALLYLSALAILGQPFAIKHRSLEPMGVSRKFYALSDGRFWSYKTRYLESRRGERGTLFPLFFFFFLFKVRTSVCKTLGIPREVFDRLRVIWVKKIKLHKQREVLKKGKRKEKKLSIQSISCKCKCYSKQTLSSKLRNSLKATYA